MTADELPAQVSSRCSDWRARLRVGVAVLRRAGGTERLHREHHGFGLHALRLLPLTPLQS